MTPKSSSLVHSDLTMLQHKVVQSISLALAGKSIAGSLCLQEADILNSREARFQVTRPVESGAPRDFLHATVHATFYAALVARTTELNGRRGILKL